MLILFDLLGAQPNGNGNKFHGGGEYIKTVFAHLMSIKQNQDVGIVVFYNHSLFLDEWIVKLISDNNLINYDISEYNEIEKIFHENTIDVYFSGMPYNHTSFAMPEKTLKIGTFHGLRLIEKPGDKYEYMYKKGLQAIKARVRYAFPQLYLPRFKKHYQNAMQRFDTIITDSNHSKYSMKTHDICEQNVLVIYPPLKHIEDTMIGERIIQEKYFLLIGGNRWEKNVYRAIIAIEDLFDKNLIDDYKVVILGKLSDKIIKRIKHIDRYCLFDYLPTDQMENLYNYCDVFVYPTLNEGFGYPPLEAMKYGKTCVVSCVCSLPEVCGDSVYYFNPYDIGEMQCRILYAVENKIDPARIEEHLNDINRKQSQDLDVLCQLLLLRDS